MDAILSPIESTLISAVSKAITALTAILDNNAAPAAHRLRAACTILRISTAWPKQREAFLADTTSASRGGNTPRPSLASAAPQRSPQPEPRTTPASGQLISPLTPGLQTLPAPVSTPPLPTSRTAALLASAGAAPRTPALVPSNRITPITLPLAMTG